MKNPIVDLLCLKENEKKHFENESAALDKAIGNKLPNPLRRKHSNKGQQPFTILDVGCKFGFAAPFLINFYGQENVRYIGIDINKTVIAYNKDYFANVKCAEFHCIDINNLTKIKQDILQDKKVDLIYLGHPVVYSPWLIRIFHRNLDQQLTAFETFIISEIPEILKAGGIIVAAHYHKAESTQFKTTIKVALNHQAWRDIEGITIQADAFLQRNSFFTIIPNYSPSNHPPEFKSFYAKQTTAESCRRFGCFAVIGAAAYAGSFILGTMYAAKDIESTTPGFRLQ